MSKTPQRNESQCLVVNAAEGAALLGISERHFWACHRDGKLGPRPISLGRSKRWDRAELKAWLEAGGPNRVRWDELKSMGKDASGA